MEAKDLVQKIFVADVAESFEPLPPALGNQSWILICVNCVHCRFVGNYGDD